MNDVDTVDSNAFHLAAQAMNSYEGALITVKNNQEEADVTTNKFLAGDGLKKMHKKIVPKVLIR